MEDKLTLTFDNVVGQKIPKEQIEATAGGFVEAYRRTIPGGVRVTLAKYRVAMINGNRREVLWLDTVPPADLLPDATLKVVGTAVATVGKDREGVSGVFGIVDGRKFFAVAAEKKDEPKAERVKSAGAFGKAGRSKKLAD